MLNVKIKLKRKRHLYCTKSVIGFFKIHREINWLLQLHFIPSRCQIVLFLPTVIA